MNPRLRKHLKNAITISLLVSIGIIVTYKFELLSDIILNIGYPSIILVVILWSLLAVASPYFTLLSLKPELLKKLNTVYYDIAINRLLAKYIPGGLWGFFGKGLDLAEKGIDARAIKSVLLFELVCPFIAALLVSVSTIIILQSKSTVIAITLILVVATLLYLFTRVSILRHSTLRDVDYFRGVLLVSVYWIIAASIFGLYYVLAVASCNLECAVTASSHYVLAWAVGYAVPFAPQGLGVSELSFSLLSTRDIAETAVIQMIGFRLIVLLGDILGVAIRLTIKFLRARLQLSSLG